MIVITIIGFLAMAAIYAINVTRIKSRDARRKADLLTIAKALEFYYHNYGRYPISNECGATRTGQEQGVCFTSGDPSNPSTWFLGNKLKSLGYLGSTPFDPKNGSNCYYYYYTTTDGKNFSISATLENPTAEDLATQNISPPNWSSCIRGNYRAVRQ